MCIRHPTNCSVQSVTERGAEVLPWSSACGRGRQVSKLQRARVCPGHQGSGTPFPMVLKHEAVKPPLLNILHITKKMGLFDNVCRPAKMTLMYVPWCCLFSTPVPLRQGPQRKPIHNPPKTPPPSNFLITSALHQGQIPWAVPIRESSAVDPSKDSHPEPATDHVLVSSRTRISRPPAITRVQ
jgi:hypothetical protein